MKLGINAPPARSGWRAGHTLAALDALNRSFPGSKNWPIVCAGQSGGAKRATYLAPLLAAGGYRVVGCKTEKPSGSPMTWRWPLHAGSLLEDCLWLRSCENFLETRIASE